LESMPDVKLASRIGRAIHMAVPHAATGIEKRSQAEFMNWLISWAIKSKKSGDERWETLEAKQPTHSIYRKIFPPEIRENCRLFYEMKEFGFLRRVSVAKIEDPEEFIAIVQSIKPQFEKHKAEKIETSTKIDPEEHKIFENSKWIVYVPKTKGAACALGSDAWCTTARKPTRTQDPEGTWKDPYLSYHSLDDPLIIFHLKKSPDDRFQFHYGMEEFVDRNNDEIYEFDEMKHGKPEQLIFHELNDIVKTEFGGILPAGPIKDANRFSMVRANPEDDTTWHEKGPWRERWLDDNLRLHRVGGPAFVINYDGENFLKNWYQYGLRHRDDGPAIVRDGGRDYDVYYLNGENYDRNVAAWQRAVEKK